MAPTSHTPVPIRIIILIIAIVVIKIITTIIIIIIIIVIVISISQRTSIGTRKILKLMTLSSRYLRPSVRRPSDRL